MSLDGGPRPPTERSVPVSRYRIASSDPDEAVEHMRAAYTHIEVAPVDPEGFEFSLSGARTGPLELSVLQHSAPIVAQVEPPDPVVAVATRGDIELQLRAGREEADGPVVLAPSRPCTADVRPHVHATVVTLDRAEVARIAAELAGLDPTVAPDRGLAFHAMTPRTPALGRYWVRLAVNAQRDLLDDEAMAEPLLRAQLVRQLAVGLLTVFPNTTHTVEPTAGHDSGEPATVRRAVSFIDAHAGEPIGLTEIAEAARIGPRGLQHAFARHRRTTPLGYLRQVRLERVHRDLLGADPATGDTVAAVAASWGFTHPSRFTADYRRRFGQPPSTTLRA